MMDPLMYTHLEQICLVHPAGEYAIMFEGPFENPTGFSLQKVSMLNGEYVPDGLALSGNSSFYQCDKLSNDYDRVGEYMPPAHEDHEDEEDHDEEGMPIYYLSSNEFGNHPEVHLLFN